jgi:hypothetical protein
MPTGIEQCRTIMQLKFATSKLDVTPIRQYVITGEMIRLHEKNISMDTLVIAWQQDTSIY